MSLWQRVRDRFRQPTRFIDPATRAEADSVRDEMRDARAGRNMSHFNVSASGQKGERHPTRDW
jgi:hypothetical protein